MNKYESVNYIHAPLIDIEPLPEFGESKWYDIEKIKPNLPPKIDFIIVDGPPEQIGCSGLLYCLNHFSNGSVWVIDYVLREKDQKLANCIAFKFGNFKHRFRTFFNIPKNEIEKEKLTIIKNRSLNCLENKSSMYIEDYFPSVSRI